MLVLAWRLESEVASYLGEGVEVIAMSSNTTGMMLSWRAFDLKGEVLVPAFTFVLRIWNALATLREMAMRSHLDSSMAPWWVLKRTKF